MTTLDPTRPMAGPDLRPGARDRSSAPRAGGPADGRVLDLACVALAAEQAGGARRCLEMSAEYARTRFQFGRPIGSFQAVKHKCADMLVRVELAEAAAREAARLADEDCRGVPRRRRDGAHLLLTGVPVRRDGEHPGARRHRLHLGAPRPPVLPPRQVLASCSSAARPSTTSGCWTGSASDPADNLSGLAALPAPVPPTVQSHRTPRRLQLGGARRGRYLRVWIRRPWRAIREPVKGEPARGPGRFCCTSLAPAFSLP